MILLRKALVPVALAAFAATSHAVISTFDTDADGWHTVTYPDTDYTVATADYGVSAFSSTGGNPGGYIYNTDPDGGDTFFAAPAKFLGNDSSAYGTNLTYDLADTGSGYNTAATVVLKGAGLVAAYTSSTVPGTSFTAFSIPLTETGWVSNTYGGTAISQSDFKAILADLTSLQIRGEYVVGGETASLDNVQLQITPTPEPGTWAALGLGAAAALRRRKK